MLQTIVFKGYSGSGKSPLIHYFRNILEANGFTVKVVDHQTRPHSEGFVKEIISKQLGNEPDFLLIGLSSKGKLEIHFEELPLLNTRPDPSGIEFMKALLDKKGSYF